MIKYLGNNKEWIDQELLKKILEGSGEKRPIVDEQDEPWKRDQWTSWLSTGYDISGVSWSMHYWHHLGLSSMSDLVLPLVVEGTTIEWWFSKLNPCTVFPMHVDAFKTQAKNFRRFCVPMQDYEPGHIFIYEGKNLEDYKAGDIFEFSDPTAWHGAANISKIPKVSFQMVCYDI